MSKKIDAKLKRAYHYFNVDKVVPLSDVEANINILKGAAAGNEELTEKINNYEAEIVEYCDSFGGDGIFRAC